MKGESGDDLLVPVPSGTMIYSENTGELIGEITEKNPKITVAKGGRAD